MLLALSLAELAFRQTHIGNIISIFFSLTNKENVWSIAIENVMCCSVWLGYVKS